MGTPGKLSTISDWSDLWAQTSKVRLQFDPERPSFRDLHRLFQKTLPKDSRLRMLEVGCYPGRYLWYFNRYFGYQVSGLEYVDCCCRATVENLREMRLDGKIIHADIFRYEPPPPVRCWDVVASFGFVEHFENTALVLGKHLDLLKPGGYLVIIIPNHHGIYGRILRAADPEKYRIHNLMPYQPIADALRAAGTEVLEEGYYGRIGFWNCGLYQRLHRLGRLTYFAVRAPLAAVEHLGRIIPNSHLLSPNAAVVARKRID